MKKHAIAGAVLAVILASAALAFIESTLTTGTIFTTQTPTGGGTAGGHEVGMQFSSSQAGTITALRFWKSSADTQSSHTGHLWIETGTDTGTLVATVTFTNETPSGWQEQTLSSPVTIAAYQNYRVSYAAPNGTQYVYSVAPTFPVTNSPLTGLSGCYHQNGTGIFPDARITNYMFADVRFTPSANPTATPTNTPTSTSTSTVTPMRTATPTPSGGCPVPPTPTPPAAHFCNDECTSRGHFNHAAAAYPFTEDISSSTSAPYSDPIVIGSDLCWTTIQGGCDLIASQNIQASTTVNLMLRAMTAISASQNGYSTTAAIGARYEVQLQIDGQPYGWFVRRLRAFPQNDYFETTAQNVPAGNHNYTLAVRLLDPGQIVFGQRWLTATGSPVANPSGRSVLPADLALNTAAQVASDEITFTSSQTLDVFVNGYMQIDSGTPGELLTISFERNGSASHTTTLATPPALYAGVNFVDYFLNVPAGTHTLRWKANSTVTNWTAAWRAIEFVTFPAAQGGAFDSYLSIAGERGASPPITVSTSTGEVPGPAILQGCGLWTRVLTLSTQANSGLGGTTLAFTGYVQVSNVSNPGWVQFAITGSQQGFDLGIISPGVVSGPDGYYLFSDADIETQCNGCTFTLWARKVYLCGDNTGAGSFDVGQSYLAAKFTPNDSCRY